MPFKIQKAVKEQLKLLIALAGPSGSGKTYSALRIAQGLANGGKILVVDTEAKRSLQYANKFQFDHIDFAPPFSPERFTDVIEQGEKEGYDVIVIDSISHEWSGQGGILDMAEKLMEKMDKKDTFRRVTGIKKAGIIQP